MTEATDGEGGEDGVVATYSLHAPFQDQHLSQNGGTPVFVGNTQQITVTETQRLTGFAAFSANVDFGVATTLIYFDLCYQLNGAGDVLNFVPSQIDMYPGWVTNQILPYAVGATKVIGVAGTHKVGVCVGNPSSPTVHLYGVSGWVQATN